MPTTPETIFSGVIRISEPYGSFLREFAIDALTKSGSQGSFGRHEVGDGDSQTMNWNYTTWDWVVIYNDGANPLKISYRSSGTVGQADIKLPAGKLVILTDVATGGTFTVASISGAISFDWASSGV